MLAVYSLLRILLMDSRKVMLAGAVFRQSKVIFEYMEGIYYNAPILRDVIGKSKRVITHDTDLYRFRVGDSVCTAIPIGDGSKIRGQRANDLLVDEFSALPQAIFENVLAGFAAVKSHPIEHVMKYAADKLAKELGIFEVEEEDSDNTMKDNQIIISGTAYYDFNHFGTYWKDWHEIICSKGNPQILAEYFRKKAQTANKDDIEVPEGFNWKDYSIIRIPFEMIPPGFMDSAQVARSKATVHAGIYLMEFGACQPEGTLIITDKGIMPIQQVNDTCKVLTHKGRFMPVNKVFARKYNGIIYEYKTLGFNQGVLTTPEHPFYSCDDFYKIGQINKTNLANLKILNNNHKLDISELLDEETFLETLCGEYFYPRGSKAKYNVRQQRWVRRVKTPSKNVESMWNISQSSVSYIRNNKNIPKNSIPKEISLDENFGLILGYYASEGSIYSNGNGVSFALDEHKDTEYQKQLVRISKEVFGFSAKRYVKQKNTVEIGINSRLVADLLKFICPGNSHTKFIRHHILFSNKELLRGFIVGYWNGDGHVREDAAIVHCVNKNLLLQVRLALSYFSISSTLNFKKDKTYELKLTGESYRHFMLIFYNKKIKKTNRKSRITNNGEFSILPIVSKSKRAFSGYVYNLEVEEDESYSTLNSTIHNCFSTDSNGFFSRKLIESCVASPQNPITNSAGEVFFEAVLRGDSDRRYVYGIDPASEIDNFSIVIIELWGDHRRIVYGWTTNRHQHNEEIQAKLVQELDYYSYCAKKIRWLMNVFPCERIMMDSQGGGIPVMEALHDPDKYDPDNNEHAIWPVKDPEKPLMTDAKVGLHIVELVNFASAAWTEEANHGMRKDLEDKFLLFPYFDAITIADACAKDYIKGSVYDTLEDCVMDIEELKDELSTIIITQTTTGRDKWDTPEVKLPGGRKGRLRKDRYSALVMANMGARLLMRAPAPLNYDSHGGFAQRMPAQDGAMYAGNEEFDRWAREAYK